MKAILVMDMPKTCDECKLANEDYDVCQATQKSISYNERGYGIECPLKPLPQKNKYDGDKYATVDYENDVNLGHYLNKGWNACIDEILRGEE